MTSDHEQLQQLLTAGTLGEQLTAVNQLRELDPAIAFELIQTATTSSHARVRYAAISQISELGKQDRIHALRILQTALNHDPETDVQAAAADSIGALQLTEAFDDLKKVYDQTSEWLLQMSIVACLGDLGDPRAFELLQEALTAPNDLIVLTAIGALGELRDERALPLLLRYVNHEDWQVRHRLVQALSHYPQPEAQAQLQQFVHDPSEIVVVAAKAHLP